MSVECWQSMVSPVGRLLLGSRHGRLAAVLILASGVDAASAGIDANVRLDAVKCPVLQLAAQQFCEYFAGRRRQFDLPLELPAASNFTRRVLDALRTVPYAFTLTYGELAARAGSPGAARAVGQAMAANPLPIVIPCHRVIAAGGGLGGYSGGDGLPTKQWLLAFERNNCQSS